MKASLGAYALRAQTREQLEHALIEAREHNRTSVVVQRVVGYES
jgi:TPP-dependent trihydroxycyclohexane-1,2-dione (THcHDO) dehydratase